MYDLISSEYSRLMTEYHDAGHGISGERRAGRVAELIVNYKVHSMLDYGCGQGTLVKALNNLMIIQDCEFDEYDPGVPGKNLLPEEGYDLITSTDVLEHIEPKKLDNVLANIDLLSKKYIYLVIATHKASITLSDGRNAHLIIKPATWWLKKIKSAFPKYKVNMIDFNNNDVEIIVDKTKQNDDYKKMKFPTLAESQKVKIASDADFLGIWQGQPSLIIGSGKSKNYLPFNPDLNRFPGKIIGCNSAFSVGYHTDMIIFIDGGVLNRYGEAMAQIDCLKFSIACDPPNFQDILHGNDIHWLLAKPPERFSDSFDSGFYPADLTGYLALNVALLMGYNPIWLHGFDSWQHEVFSKAERFKMAANWAKENGREIYVTDEDSYFCHGDNLIFKYKLLPLPTVADKEG